jgi:hypothetical protein
VAVIRVRTAVQVPAARTGDRVVDDQTRRLASAVQSAAASPLGEARLLVTDTDGSDGLAFTAGTPRLVDHGLGRPVRGVLEVLRPSDTAGARPNVSAAHSATTVDLAKQVRLVSASNGRCYLLVF